MKINKEKLDGGFEIYEVFNQEGDLVYITDSYREARRFDNSDAEMMDTYDYTCVMEWISSKIF